MATNNATPTASDPKNSATPTVSSITKKGAKAEQTGQLAAALIMFAVTVPILATLISVAAYIALPATQAGQLPTNWMAIPLGTVVSLSAWLVLGILYTPFTSVENANPSSYERLQNRLHQLEVWLEVLTTHKTRAVQVTQLSRTPAIVAPDVQEPCKEAEIYTICKAEVQRYIDAIKESLKKKSLSWVTASGYVNLWMLMHRADEAMIGFEPIEAIIRDALHDEMSIAGSNITNREELLNKLRKAVKVLSEPATTYLSQQPAERPDFAINELQVNKKIEIDQRESSGNVLSRMLPLQGKSSAKQLSASVQTKARTSKGESVDMGERQARMVIREVKFSLHQFRDDRWDKLVRVRNHLYCITVLTGIALYVLLAFGIIIQIQTRLLEAAMIFFLVGAIVGLFSRLYSQSKIDTSIDDFRLATARLIAAPLYSGTAAIGGVLVLEKIAIFGIGASDYALSSSNIILAAIFGLAPGLFTTALQKEADRYKDDIKSTAAPTGAREKN